jgi:hypothetical protein
MDTFFKTAISLRTCSSEVVLANSNVTALSKERAHHMFSPRHESLVYDLGGIVSACINVYTLLDNRVRSST